jgi:transposase-like protein
VATGYAGFFLYSEKGSRTVTKRRKPRKRGGKAKKAGISEEQVPVILGCDRQGELVLGVAGRGRITLKNIEEVLGDRIDDEATLCTDSHSSFRAFAKANQIKYRPVNVSKGQRVVKKVFHVQHANSAHARLKGWMARFRGVSTKHLDSYAQWFGLMEETKILNDREAEFTQRRRK